MQSNWFTPGKEEVEVEHAFLSVVILGEIWDSHAELEQLGDGTYGTVSMARSSGRLVAVKAFKKTYEPINFKGAAAEVVISYKASHRAIAKFEGAYLSPLDSSIYMSMEYMDAGCLRDLIFYQDLPPAAVARVVQEILLGLEYLHSNGVIHRDIKPENVLVNRAGAIKIADFGLATFYKGDCASDCCYIGTPYYMAPEYTFSTFGYGFGVDIWAVGIIAFEMLQGDVPYADQKVERATMLMFTQGRPKVPETLVFDRILDSLLDANPRTRASASSVLERKDFRNLVRACDSLAPFIEAGIKARITESQFAE
ncbi:hypothetical protein QFC22_001711 [Naganishia vaughanmartiniae]|uniref:Uncharacterized protein n=1 Tax=Naganishia vaughanmartiniae TaxID=1424756 RepID=A0ACC2XE22_9TREE|nr:hypothetical protein QFC22_001711 [Naganishia vaughanmartiniae]